MGPAAMFTERYRPEQPFPAYAFIPGRHPHPVTDPQGHSYGIEQIPAEPLDPNHPRTSPEYLYGIDLFNSGYYWEAHEAWEDLWNAAGRSGQTADFLKGLIKLAAAGVKAREGQPVGVTRHAVRAAELFKNVASSRRNDSRTYAGLQLEDLQRIANSLAAAPIVDTTVSVSGLTVFPYRLRLVLERPQEQ